MRITKGIVSLLLMVSGNLLAQNTISGGEYWIDSDFSGRSSISLAASENLNYQANIDVNSLVNGLHTIHYRFIDDNNSWSSVASEFFVKRELYSGSVARDVVSFEYWIDSDFDNRIEETITSVQDFNLTTSMDVADLINGLHTIHYRFKDSEDVWSSVLSKYFVKKETYNGSVTKEIVSYEYWFDAGFDDRTEQSIDNSVVLNLTENLDVSALRNGLHTVHYRFMDSDKIWSSVISEYMVCKAGEHLLAENKIVGYRYWFNNGSITEVELENGLQNLAFLDTLEMYTYRKGEYFVSLQFKDEYGLWSAPLTDRVEKIGFPIAAIQNSPPIVCDTATIDFLSEAYDADSLLWTINNIPVTGDTTLSYFFSQTGEYEVMLTAIDTVLDMDSSFLVKVVVDTITAALIQGEYFAICSGDSMQLVAAPGYSYLWNSDETTSTIIAKDEQWYIVEATTDLLCKQRDSVFLIVYDTPVVDLGGDQSLSENNSVELDAGTGFTSYHWYDNDDERIKIISGSTLGMGDHQVFVSVTDANSCRGSDTITISVTAAVGIGESGAIGIKLFPVPVQEHLTIEIPETMVGTSLRVYNSSGQIINEQNLENETTVIDMSRFTSGYYMLTFINKERVYQKMVVLSR